MASKAVFENGSRLPEPCPPQAGCWCSRYERRPNIRLIVLGSGPRQAVGLRPWIPTLTIGDQQMPPDTTVLTLPSSYKACSAFTRVAACTLALSPIRDTLSEGFSHFVTSMTAPIASGRSGCRVGFAPTGKSRLITAHTLSRWGGWLPLPASKCHVVEAIMQPRAKGATRHGNYHGRPRSGQARFSSSRHRRQRRSCCAQDAASSADDPVFCRARAVSGGHRGVWDEPLLGPRDWQAWPRGAPDAAGLCEALRQAWEDRRERCRGDLRGGEAPNDVLRRDQVPGATGGAGDAQDTRPVRQAAHTAGQHDP